MSGKVIVRNAKTLSFTPLDVFIDGKKVGHVANNGVSEFPIAADCELSVKCGINPLKPKVKISANFITEVQFKITPVVGTFSLEIVRQQTLESAELEKKEKEEQERKAQADKAWEQRERRMRCNVCGNVFCYTYSDIKANKRQAGLAALSAVGTMASAIGGTRYDMYEQSKNANIQSDKVKDFSRCPHCNSTNIVEIQPNETTSAPKNNMPSVSQLSAADELKKFKELLDMDIITQEEFDAKKKQLLGL